MTISAEVVPVRALRDNYIWMIVDDAARTVWAVDPGEAEPVLHFIKKRNLVLSGILLTHHHGDHAGGIPDLLKAAHVPVYASAKSPHAFVTHRLCEGDIAHCGTLQFEVLEIPGHTLDHAGYFGHGMLFSGDTLFSAGCGRVFEGTPAMMFATLKKLEKIAVLDPATKVYCGHEYTLANLRFAKTVEPENSDISKKITQVQNMACTLPSRLSDELLFNPFLRCEEPAVIRAAGQHAGRELSSSVEVFQVLREWKNGF
jgi:hydroxyacylglutathione hydrolase